MHQGPAAGRFPKPSKTVIGLMVGLLFIWVTFAIALNWAGGAGKPIVSALVGSGPAVLSGQVWRLVTAALFNHMSGPGAVFHILIVLLLFYFFLTPLEERWGRKKLLIFLFGSAAFAYAVETLMFLVLPGVASAKWFGSMVMADAAIVAWAIGSKDSVVRLYFVLPMKPMVMVGIILAFNVLQLIARDVPPEGVFAPFAAMGAGYLFGGDSSPVRRLYLKWKLKRLQSEVDHLQRKRRKRGGPDLRVIPGGADDEDDDPVLH